MEHKPVFVGGPQARHLAKIKKETKAKHDQFEADFKESFGMTLDELNFRNMIEFHSDILTYIINHDAFPPGLSKLAPIRARFRKEGIVICTRIGRGFVTYRVSDAALALLDEMKKGDRVLD